MKQMFGTDNHYVQDEGCGHEILFVPVNSGEQNSSWQV